MTKMSPFQIKNFRKQTGLSQKPLHKQLTYHLEHRSYESREEVSPLASSEGT